MAWSNSTPALRVLSKAWLKSFSCFFGTQKTLLRVKVVIYQKSSFLKVGMLDWEIKVQIHRLYYVYRSNRLYYDSLQIRDQEVAFLKMGCSISQFKGLVVPLSVCLTVHLIFSTVNTRISGILVNILVDSQRYHLKLEVSEPVKTGVALGPVYHCPAIHLPLWWWLGGILAVPTIHSEVGVPTPVCGRNG